MNERMLNYIIIIDESNNKYLNKGVLESVNESRKMNEILSK